MQPTSKIKVTFGHYTGSICEVVEPNFEKKMGSLTIKGVKAKFYGSFVPRVEFFNEKHFEYVSDETPVTK
jgi:hypothetical protein